MVVIGAERLGVMTQRFQAQLPVGGRVGLLTGKRCCLAAAGEEAPTPLPYPTQDAIAALFANNNG